MISLCFSGGFGQSGNGVFRPPAIPLITCDPYFSIWSFSDHPADDWPRHWTGSIQALCSMIRIDGKTYGLIGTPFSDLPKLPLDSTEITPTRTIYHFSSSTIRLDLTFLTPLLPQDLMVLSQPVGYISWRVSSHDGNSHDVALYFDNSGELAVNTSDEKVVWARFDESLCEVLSLGTQAQPILQQSGDNLRINWGYVNLVVPKSENARIVVAGDDSARGSFLHDGTVPSYDDMRFPRRANDEWPVLACKFDLGVVKETAVERFIALAYDDQYSIEYFGRKLRPYWRSAGAEMGDLVNSAVEDYPSLRSRCELFDSSLYADLDREGGKDYAELASLAYRQAIAAHELVVDVDGTPLFFPKENFSNGCIGTVDVIYPAAPVLLLFNPALEKATLTPIFQYAGMPRWHFPFAPHDLGTYPLANGQVYGGGEKSEDDQMPVEESGNMILLTYAVCRAENSPEFAEKYISLLDRWANYLKEEGFDPANQLCTDDFAGHLAHNTNLSLKAILALGSYSKICSMLGKKSTANEFWDLAKADAKRWEILADGANHDKLAFDQQGTWSQKYNLVWDDILGLHLFGKSVAEREVQFYKSKENEYGLPLDNRKDYTKLDWTVWSASLAEQKIDFEEIIGRVTKFLSATPDRVPMTDWYDTRTAKQVGFQARSVVGGVFVRLLEDDSVWMKWLIKCGVRNQR